MAEISRLPGPVMDLWEWQFEGACRDADQDLFFHPEGERGSARRRRAEAAKAICATCPVIKECREQSLTVREPYGVWGGLSEDERAAVLAQRRPRQPASADHPLDQSPLPVGTTRREGLSRRASAPAAPAREGPHGSCRGGLRRAGAGAPQLT